MLLKDRTHLKGLANELGNAETPHPAPALFQSDNGWDVMKNADGVTRPTLYGLNGYTCDLGFQEKPTKSLA